MMTTTTTRSMISKFPGTCKACGQRFPAGVAILWSKEGGARHAIGQCPKVDLASALQHCTGAVKVTVTDVHAAAAVICSNPSQAHVFAAAVAPSPVTSTCHDAIAAFINAAKARMIAARKAAGKSGDVYPKARFLAPDGKSELRLSVAGPTSKAPGAIQVKIENEWIGRIEANGNVVGWKLRNDAAVLATLTAIAADPAKAASAYGAMTSQCSFCNRALENDGSIEVGYGKRCAHNYGLPHHTAKPRVLSAVPVAVDPEDEFGLAEHVGV